MQRISVLVGLFSLLMLFACQQESKQENENAAEAHLPVIVVVNYPLEFIVESLVGPDVKVINPVPPDADPETWIPDDDMTQIIQQADLIVTNGADFADWVKKLSLPRSKVLKTSLFLKEDLISVPDYEVHSHGTGGAHSHAGTVAFFWLDPALMIKQADAIAQKLILLFPQKKETITANLKKLKKSLAALNREMNQLKTEYSGLHWFSQRPVYQYLARRSDWTVHHLHWKKNADSDENAWGKLKTMQEKQKVPLMFWEEQPAEKIIKQLQQLGVSSFVFNPLTTEPAEGDYLTEMQRQLNELTQFLKNHSSSQDPSKK